MGIVKPGSVPVRIVVFGDYRMKQWITRRGVELWLSGSIR